MLFCAVQEPHFERVARIVTFPYRRPQSRANSSTRVGRYAFASARNFSISSADNGAAAGRAAYFALARNIHSRLLSKNSNARLGDMYGGNDSLTSPEGRTLSVMRRARRVQDMTTSPSEGW